MSSKASTSESSKGKASKMKLEYQIDEAWKQYSLDAPRVPNPIPSYTAGLRRICIIVHFVLPLAKILVGSRFADSCPTNGWLPTYMVVGGLLQLAFFIALVYKRLRQPALLAALGLAVLMWILVASINIFVEWKPDFFLGGWRYCHKTFFYFAFFVSVSEYIIVALLILYVCTQFAYTHVDEHDIV